jgi:hypothetical protein
MTSGAEVWTAIDGLVSRESVTADGMEGRGVRVRMTRISRVDELGTPNPVRRRDGVTI